VPNPPYFSGSDVPSAGSISKQKIGWPQRALQCGQKRNLLHMLNNLSSTRCCTCSLRQALMPHDCEDRVSPVLFHDSLLVALRRSQ